MLNQKERWKLTKWINLHFKGVRVMTSNKIIISKVKWPFSCTYNDEISLRLDRKKI